MEKLTETLNALKISKSAKDKLIEIAEKEHLQIQQVYRRLLYMALENYVIEDKKNTEKKKYLL
jgi:inactivated superfamily I helicase